jgi:rhodanese-related sulfurtransferase
MKLGSFYRKATTWVCHKFNTTFLFPENKYITVEQLLQFMDDKKHPPLLLDCRKESEFNESHIEGAINMHDRQNFEQLNKLPKNTLIVTYCAVGLRSGYSQRKLREIGFTNVFTLKGAFYRWANMDLPMVNGKEEHVTKVVPHQILARSLLKPEIRTALFKNGAKKKEKST